MVAIFRLSVFLIVTLLLAALPSAAAHAAATLTEPLVQYGYGTLTARPVVTPDGEHMVTGSGDGNARLWDLDTGEVVRTLGGGRTVTAVGCSPDGLLLLTGHDDAAVNLWNMGTGNFIRAFTGHGGDADKAINTVAFSPDGSKVLTGSSDSTAKLWNTNTGELLRTFTGHTKRVTAAVFTPDGAQVLTGAEDNQVRVWNAQSGELIRTFAITGAGVFTGLDVSGNGALLLTGARGYYNPDAQQYYGEAKLWNLATGEEQRTFTISDGCYAVAFSPDGSRVLAGGRAWIPDTDQDIGKVVMWNAETGAEILTFTGHDGGVDGIDLTPDGAGLLTGGTHADVAPKLWNTDTGGLIRNFTGHTLAVSAVALSGDLSKVLTTSQMRDGKMNLWETPTGALIRSFGESAGPAALSPNGSIAAAGHRDKIKLWDTATGAAIRELTGHSSNISVVEFSPDGMTLLTASIGGPNQTVILWNVATGAQLQSFPGSGGTFSPDGMRVLTWWDFGGDTKTLWDAATGAQLRQYTSGKPGKAAFSDDSATILVAERNGAGSVAILDAATGAILQSASLYETKCFSPDGTMAFASNNTSGGAQVCNAGTGVELLSLDESIFDVQDAGFFPNGIFLLTGGGDGIARLWALPGEPRPVRVPALTGVARTAARQLAEAAGMYVRNETGRYDAVVPAEQVLEQQPAANLLGDAGAPVDLVYSLGVETVAVPNLAGLERIAARQAITAARLYVGGETEAYHPTAPVDEVVGQTPAAGAQAQIWTTVDMVVSKGPQPVAVPNVSGMTLTEAQAALAGAGLAQGVVTLQFNNIIPVERVISQTPAAGATVPPGTLVNLAVSKGPQTATVPDLAGLTQTQAQAAITGLGLVVGTVTQEYHPTTQVGRVISQTPAAGSQAAAGSLVNFAVSMGPQPVEQEGEPETPPTPEEARNQLSAGFDAADTDADQFLSFGEAQLALPGLTRDVFDQMDADGNGLLDRDELGMDGDGGCGGCGGCRKGSFTPGAVKGRLADLFLLGLGLVVLGVVRRTG